jgi:thiamine biosynthesis protein ThiS
LKIQLNGELHETASATISALLEELRLDGQWVVVERNLTVPDKASWDRTAIEEGDQIEIVRFLGGG